ncbi:unnamed protein product [Linum trigynum]|uniref:Retrotransposon Copia-like N-terminal domain-containing protein n=1 Tax=Linum trigynum TaxID=586398 RepID=A0AAV2CB38_9ROSI
MAEGEQTQQLLPSRLALDPYYVNPNENLSQGIISVKLDGSNYHVWSRSMRIDLKTKKKLGFIDGSLPMPETTDPNYEAWEQSNTNVVGWILHSLLEPIAEAVMDNETAQDMWKDLRERYGETDSIRLAHVRTMIACCKQGNDSVTDFYNRLGLLWTEFMSFKSIPACECGGVPYTFTCATYAAVKQSQEQDHTIDFITRLNDSFEMTKNQLLLMDPAPT